MKYFKIINAPYDEKRYIISGTDSFYNYFGYTDGSYNVYQARIFGLTYASYLKMARDIYEAEIKGKGHRYPSIYFKEKDKAMKLAKILDERLIALLKNSK